MERAAVTTSVSPLTPFTVPTGITSLRSWGERVWQDLQPTHGRLSTTLRLVLATVLTMLTVLILQVPYASVALYFVFFVGRESPAVSLRSLFTVVPIAAAVAIELGIVIVTDNDPMARVVAVAVVSFLAGILMVGTTQPAPGSVLAYI